MRILAVADTHLGFKAGRTSTARETIYKHVFDAFEAVLKTARSEKVDTVLHAGDLFNRSKPTKKIVAKAYGLIESLLTDDIGFIVVPGNHDRSHLPPTLLSSLFEHGNFVGRMTKIDLGDVSIIGFPYDSKMPGRSFSKAGKIAASLGNQPSIILCHQLFDGATWGPHQFRFTNRKDALRVSGIPNQVQLVVTGHIHRAQALQGNLAVYPGSLERTSFAEVIEPKGYLLINIDSDGHEVAFQKVDTFPMDVLELDIGKSIIDHSKIEEKLATFSGRMMLRLTGRSLTLEESVGLFKSFPATEWPFLTIAPSAPKRFLRPLYRRYKGSFSFKKLRSQE
ncbi:MAG: exonuclease SbcCD subunit D [Candidatus Heimdallarchaeota archaeon]